jgi:hypothetical protein
MGGPRRGTKAAIAAINALSKRIWKDFVIQIIFAIFPAPDLPPFDPPL